MTSRKSYSAGSGIAWQITGQEFHLDDPLLMGILNVTPDSFSDGGDYLKPEKAIDHGLLLLSQGAHIIDVGGESTRPGSIPVDAKTEISRVIPVIKGVLKSTDALISIDTQKTEVAQAALQAGARIINDVSGGHHDPAMLPLVAESGAGFVMMHMQGTPETMQNNPRYKNILTDIIDYFKSQVESAQVYGIDRDQLVIDPGIGFGKTLDDNLHIQGRIEALHELGLPILLGASRKSFIGGIDSSSSENRLGGSLAAVLAGYLQNVKIFRVHDVYETRQLLEVFTAIQKHSV